jgi:hypothetical protein
MLILSSRKALAKIVAGAMFLRVALHLAYVRN